MYHDIQLYEAQKHSISNQINHIYFGGLHNTNSLLKKENLSLLRGLVKKLVIYFLVSMKFNTILFFPTSSLKE